MWDRLEMYVDIYDNNDKIPYQVWIWKKESIYKQIKEAYKNNLNMKFVPNMNGLKNEELAKEMSSWQQGEQWNNKWWNGNKWNSNKKWGNSKPSTNWAKWWNSGNTNNTWNWGFSIKDIKLGEWYDWYIKLQYNYWMFITVKWVEWLLHKNFIKAPEWVEWKKYYNIWDKIRVKAKEFKEVNDEKKVVWSQI